MPKPNILDALAEGPETDFEKWLAENASWLDALGENTTNRLFKSAEAGTNGEDVDGFYTLNVRGLSKELLKQGDGFNPVLGEDSEADIEVGSVHFDVEFEKTGADDTLGDSASANTQVLSGGNGDDAIVGGLGDDIVAGNKGNDLIETGAGNDFVKGGHGSDTIDGGDGNDYLVGDYSDSTRHEEKSGEGWNDWIKGGKGDDVVLGNQGDDRLNGGSGNDTVDGGTGNDRIEHSKGFDAVSGGTGSDTFTFDNRQGSEAEDGTVTTVTTINDFELGVDKMTFRMDNFQPASHPDGKFGYFEFDAINDDGIHTRNQSQATVSTQEDIQNLVDNILFLETLDPSRDNSVTKDGDDLVLTMESSNHDAFSIVLEGIADQVETTSFSDQGWNELAGRFDSFFFRELVSNVDTDNNGFRGVQSLQYEDGSYVAKISGSGVGGNAIAKFETAADRDQFVEVANSLIEQNDYDTLFF